MLKILMGTKEEKNSLGRLVREVSERNAAPASKYLLVKKLGKRMTKGTLRLRVDDRYSWLLSRRKKEMAKAFSVLLIKKLPAEEDSKMILRVVWWHFTVLLGILCLMMTVCLGLGRAVAGTLPPQSISATAESPNIDSASDLRLQAGRAYFNGHAYLIPRHIDEVKAALLSNEQAAQGLNQSEITAYALEDMESDWVKVYYHFHPQIFAQGKIERLRALNIAKEEGNIAPEEEQRWKDVVQKLLPTQSQGDDKLLKDLPITRYTFSMNHLSDSLNVEEHVVLMDVSTLIGPSPLTLLWYAGEKTSWHRTDFKFFSCMPGVTCVPDPHWEKETQTEDFVNVVRTAHLENIARRFSAYSSTYVRELELVMDGEAAPRPAIAPLQPPRRLADGLVVTADWYVLHGIDSALKNGPIRSLSGGHFYFPGGTKNDAGSLLLLKGETISVQPVRGGRYISESQVDALGRLWLMRNETPDWTSQIKHSCVRQVSNSGEMQESGICMQSTLTPRWLLRADGRSYLYAESHMATRNQFPERVMDMRSGKAIGMQTFWTNRSEVIQRALHERLPKAPSEGPDLGDGLFWFTNHGLVGISPETGKAEKSYRLSVKGPVFGSSAGDWVLAKAVRLDNYKYAYRIQRLSSGEPIFELVSDFDASALARTAHGKLLAMSVSNVQVSNQVLVWDLHTGTNIARIQVPQGMQVHSTAFNREGTELWVQVWQRHSDTSGVLIWQVPASLHDAADGNSAPYESLLGN
ncbi:hypothetical protein [uncultured Pseudomonas sp.]|uniref:hypothetical protein n=1 Tax=uncultured Pseudomonas sp. TaxID=114707 RepID=UPI002599E471|nr:hypothetical protein [uncultured Pseudomonas sp.]